MLRQEEAQERLKQVRIENWQDKRATELGRLPKKLSTIGRGLLGRDTKGKDIQDWQTSQEMRKEANRSLQVMSSKDRQRIFSVLVPNCASALEQMWNLLPTLPYMWGHVRKAYRAPSRPELAATVREYRLNAVLNCLGPYNPDPEWAAAWAPYISGYGDSDALGLLLGAVINQNDEQADAVFEILCESAKNEHEIGYMGRHVSRALLVASRPDGWELMEKILLAAQRQEGLRQVILETADEAHPEAFRRMLRLLLEHNLVRFSSVVRAFDVWLGLQWSALTPAKIKRSLEELLSYLEDDKACKQAIDSGEAESAYLALWTLGFTDAVRAVEPAAALLKDPDVERRYVAVQFLRTLSLPDTQPHFETMLADDDLRVALLALDGTEHVEDPKGKLFDPIVALTERMPEKPRTLEALVWPWTEREVHRENVAQRLFSHLGKRPITAILPYLPVMGQYGRYQLLNYAEKQKKWPAEIREVLFELVGDRGTWIQERALTVLKKCSVTEAEALQIEGYLTRKSAGLRRGVLGLLKKQPTAKALESADRLLASSKFEQRRGGLELLREMVEAKKGVAAARERAEAYRESRKNLKELETHHLEAILDEQRVVLTLDNALGLMNPEELTPPTAPIPKKVMIHSPSTKAILQGLDQMVSDNAEEPIEIEEYEGSQEMLLGNIGWQFPSPNRQLPLKKDLARWPLRKVWQSWWEARPKKMRDKDGLELLRARLWARQANDLKSEMDKFVEIMPHLGPVVEFMLDGYSPSLIAHPGVVADLVSWFERMEPSTTPIDYLLDAEETLLAKLPEPELVSQKNLNESRTWRYSWTLRHLLEIWRDQLDHAWQWKREEWTSKQIVRFWKLCVWRMNYQELLHAVPPDFELVLAAYDAKACTQADLLAHLLGSRQVHSYRGYAFSSLSSTTQRKPPKYLENRQDIRELVERCRQRVLEIELNRGDLPTPATEPAHALSSVYGVELAVRLLTLLGKKGLSRQSYGESRGTILSKLLHACYPAEEDTFDTFDSQMNAALKQKLFPRERLLELAFAAPQWIPYVEHCLGWEGLSEGVYWHLAHMPYSHPSMDDEVSDEEKRTDPWERYIRERTALSPQDRSDGVVDVDWFNRTFEMVGPRHWNELYEASKFGCSDAGYKKAQTIADVLRGKAKKKDLLAGIRQRQLKENVRMLGLLPLAKDNRRESDLQQRFKVLMEYRRYVRTLSPMSKEDAQRALDIGLKNLALTAGYPDPVRLEWTLEGREISDLAEGPLVAQVKDVSMTLELDAQSQPVVTIQRGSKVLKSLPKDVRKHKKFQALNERKTELKRQASRMRHSLEAMMLRGDTFDGDELQKLFEHPVLVPLLSRLILIGEGVAGYPVSKGKGLEGYNGKIEPIKKGEQLRLAHCYDLMDSGHWAEWQAHLFRIERVQPFKQVFRELYVVTKQEKKDGGVSRRYTGQQVQQNQAMALLGSRGWNTRDGVRKTFFDDGLTVELSFEYGVTTPLEVEGLTVDGVEFRKRDEWKPIPLKDVPPRIFSETMRDLDLVVSVAHVGGVDPEASASTVEMREALLKETCTLLNIDNYRIKGSHAIIDGHLSKYSVHLGSGVVHKQPGGALCIVPVHSQHRGRLFLPFADDDPRTAEVLSKVLLLARDSQIQDPTILEQLQ